MENLNNKIDNVTAMKVNQTAEMNNVIETLSRDATLSGQQIKNMKSDKTLKLNKKKLKKQLTAEVQALTFSKSENKQHSKKVFKPGIKQRKGVNESRKTLNDDSEMHDDLFNEDTHLSESETDDQTSVTAESDTIMKRTEEVTVIELLISSSEEKLNTSVFNAAQKAAVKAECQQRLKKKKWLKEMKKQNTELKSQ